MVVPDRQKKPIRFLSGWTSQIMFSFIIILAKPPLTHVIIEGVSGKRGQVPFEK